MADFNSSCRDRRRLPERSVLWLIAAFLFAGALAWGTKDGPIMPPLTCMVDPCKDYVAVHAPRPR